MNFYWNSPEKETSKRHICLHTHNLGNVIFLLLVGINWSFIRNATKMQENKLPFKAEHTSFLVSNPHYPLPSDGIIPSLLLLHRQALLGGSELAFQWQNTNSGSLNFCS